TFFGSGCLDTYRTTCAADAVVTPVTIRNKAEKTRALRIALLLVGADHTRWVGHRIRTIPAPLTSDPCIHRYGSENVLINHARFCTVGSRFFVRTRNGTEGEHGAKDGL